MFATNYVHITQKTMVPLSRSLYMLNKIRHLSNEACYYKLPKMRKSY